MKKLTKAEIIHGRINLFGTMAKQDIKAYRAFRLATVKGGIDLYKSVN